MRVLGLVPSLYDTSPGQRYRIEQWMPLLRAAGIELDYAPFEDEALHGVIYQPGHTLAKARAAMAAWRRRSRLLQDVRGYDAIYLFREATLLGPAWLERRLLRAHVPIVYDFDDAIFLRYISPSSGLLSWLKFGPSRTEACCRVATAVMVGNRHLAEYAGRYNANVHVVPSTIDTRKYLPRARPRNDVPVIGWTGSHSTLVNLATLNPVLQELAKTRRFRLRVIAPRPYPLPGVEVDSIVWRRESEVEDLAPLDIGIMPLPDDRWSRGKCGMKALQYMGLGIATVAARLEANSAIIRHGENGLLALSHGEWLAALTSLLDSESLRTSLGNAGRATVEAEYSCYVQAPRVAEIFHAAVGKRSPHVAEHALAQ